MKNLILSLLGIVCLIVLLNSCKKTGIESNRKHDKSAYRVLAIGNDTTISSSMFARTETVGIVVAEDSKLKAELISYTPLPDGRGQYVVKMTNKQSCQIILRWGWEGLTIDEGTPESDVLHGNEVVTFTLIGDAKPGKIKVQAESSGECHNSSTLIVNITTTILPITYISNSANYNEKTGKVTISFSIDDPTIIDRFIIQILNNKSEWVEYTSFKCDKKTKVYSIPL